MKTLVRLPKVYIERGHDCNHTSPKDVFKEDTKDESLKQQTQMKAMMEATMENVTRSIVKKLQH